MKSVPKKSNPGAAIKKKPLGPLEPAPRPPVKKEHMNLYVPHWSKQEYVYASTVFADLKFKMSKLRPSLLAQIRALSSTLKLLPSDTPPDWLDRSLDDLQQEVLRVRGLTIKRDVESAPSQPPHVEK